MPVAGIGVSRQLERIEESRKLIQDFYLHRATV